MSARKVREEDAEEILGVFTARYVRREFQVRFLHEAKKKPSRLLSRVCHEIERIFDSRWKATPECLPQSGEYLALYNTGFAFEPWTACKANHVLADGGLIISQGGEWFWARGEELRAAEYHSWL